MAVLTAPFIAGLVTLSTLAEERRSESVLSEWAKVRLRSVRVRIEPGVKARAGECLDLGLDEMNVELRGKSLRREQLIRFERERQANLHALVLDTSVSMKGKMQWVRDAAKRYIGQIPVGLDRALLFTFDDSVLLVHGPSDDLPRLERAIDTVRLGGNTALNDALYYVIRELDAHAERPVIVLVTDAHITLGYHEQADVRRLVNNRPDLAVFTIGLGMPELTASGPAPGHRLPMIAPNSTRKFLQNLARKSNGKWFDVPTGSGLEPVFLAIREMLESEATLELIDTDPQADPGKIAVASTRPGCRVRVLRQHGDPEPDAALVPLRRPFDEPPFVVDLPAAPGYAEQYAEEEHLFADPACPPRGDMPWYVRLDGDLVHGCGLDITMDIGKLYSTETVSRWEFNEWIQLQSRPFRISLLPVADLPTAPEQLLDGLVRFTTTTAGAPPVPDDRKLPPGLHARRYHDHPDLAHGRMFLEDRPRLARALFGWPEYRRRVMRQLDERAQRELAALKARFRKLVPEVAEAILDEAVRQSDRGRAILARAQHPTESALMDYLAAWHGDIAAHDLFLRWERLRIDRMLTAAASPPASFAEEWIELRKIFFVPSYTRTLALLSPTYDPAVDRIGFWRVVLPRPSWMLPRVKGLKRHPDYKDMPLDLVPELPYAYLTLQRVMDENPQLAARLRLHGYRVVDSGYRPLVKPWKQDARHAYMHVQARLRLQSPDDGRRVELSAELIRDRKSSDYRLQRLELSGGGPELEALIRGWAPRPGEPLRPRPGLHVESR